MRYRVSALLERLVGRRLFIGSTYVVLVALAACGSPSSPLGGTAAKHFCYQAKSQLGVPSCDCFGSDQNRSAADYLEVPDCGGSGLLCFADVTTSGTATACECFLGGCYKDANGDCSCSNGSVIGLPIQESTAM